MANILIFFGAPINMFVKANLDYDEEVHQSIKNFNRRQGYSLQWLPRSPRFLDRSTPSPESKPTFNIKVTISMLIKWSHWIPIMLTREPNIGQAHNPIKARHMLSILGATSNPHTTQI